MSGNVQAALAVVGARLFPMTSDEAIDGATVVVEGGRFTAIGAALAPPPGARVIDAGGAIVTPGLMSAGSHLGLVEISSLPETCDAAPGKGEAGPAFDVSLGLNARSSLLARARADGVTRAAVWPALASRSPLAGLGAVLRLAEGPDILDRPHAALFAVIAADAADDPGSSRIGAWGALRAALEDAKTGALAEVVAGRIPLAIAAARESDIRQAAALSVDFGVTVIVLGGAEAWRAADLLAERQIAVVIDPFEDGPAGWDRLGARPDNAAILARAGVTIGLTAFSIHFSHNAGAVVREGAGLAVANGLPWIAALRALTAAPAAIWGLADHYGRIEVGLEADLVIWDGDPLEPASAPMCVIVAGAEASLETRQTRLARRYHPTRRGDPWPPAYR
ncbi:MAG TPA: amidohydrolase family protein [Caulobacteraceae bacterium]|nr:amidohydrolase family protein [Caulobacteraceae bacterium]